jgi:hypothetical protein
MNKNEARYTEAFAELVRSNGWIFIPSTIDEDMRQHFDCIIEKYEDGELIQTLKIELKGKKYNSKKNKGIESLRTQYIEFMNVNGEIGWLYGEADYIAFEGDNNVWSFVRRTALIDFAETIFQVNLRVPIKEVEATLWAMKPKWVPSSKQAYHKLYRRFGRMDIVTRISLKEVDSLTHFTL